MMVRRLSLIVPILSAIAAVSTASAQPRQEVGPWSTMERVGETLQVRQERRAEVAEKIEERRPEFFARNADRLQADEPLMLTPLRLAGWPDGPVTIGYFGPVATPTDPAPAVPTTPAVAPAPAPAPAPAAQPTPSSVKPYRPLVLGSFFGFAGELPAVTHAPVVPESGGTLAPLIVEPPAPAPRPAPSRPAPPAATPAPKPAPPVPVSIPARPTSAPIIHRDRPADAYLNFSDGPFPAADTLAEGTPRAWYESDVVTGLLGRTPSPSEQHDFKNEVLAKVERSFRKSGLDLDLTADPAPAAHTLSVVSGALAASNPEAIGIADIGGDGFTFIDNFDSPAIATMNDLETAVANNISHELMHAFGVDYHDETGTVIDSGRIGWDLLVSDDLKFSDQAVEMLSSADFQRRWDDVLMASSHQLADHGQGCSCHGSGAGALATPEPATLAMWGLTVLGVAWSGGRWRRARA